jgi:hypothetical protein
MERSVDPLKPRLLKQFVEVAESFDDPITRITGSGLAWTGMRIFVFAHLNSEWFIYDQVEDILKIKVPDEDICRKAPDGEVCTNCQHRGKSKVTPKTPGSENRILEIPRKYTCHWTGETRSLQLTEDLLGYFKITNDYGRDTFPILADALRDRVKKIAARADERTETGDQFRKLRTQSPVEHNISGIDKPVVADIVPHDLRATLATQMARGDNDDQKATPAQIAVQLGHEDLSTTEKYFDWAEAEVSGGRRKKM